MKRRQISKQDLAWRLLCINKLREDAEILHIRADLALIRFINDENVEKAYNRIDKWYA